MYDNMFNHFKIMCYWVFYDYKWMKNRYKGNLSDSSSFIHDFFLKIVI